MPPLSDFGRPTILRTAALLAVVLAVGGAMIYVHEAAAFTLPVPWGDEAYFVWQARAFERWNSFVAPELDESRPLLLLPFVYSGLLGAAFKLFGYSFELARSVSLFFVVAGFLMLALTAWRRNPAPISATALIGAFMLNEHFVLMGNIARMEALVFAVVCVALFLVSIGRIWLALGLLVFAPMIHPNAMFFLVPVALFAWRNGDLSLSAPSRGAIILFGIAAVTWIANGAYAIKYWGGFVHETALRLGETTAAHGGISQFLGWNGAGLLMILVVLVVSLRWKPKVAALPVFALGGWLYGRVRVEHWYEAFGDLAYLLIGLAAMELVVDGATRLRLPRPRAAAIATAIGILAIAFVTGRVEGPVNYLHDMNVTDMRIATSHEYFQVNDRIAIENLLRAERSQCPVRVEVYPWGDALFVADLDEQRVRFQVPYFDPLFQPPESWAFGYAPTEGPEPDLFIIRQSRHHPDWLNGRERSMMARALRFANADGAAVFHGRDGSEKWIAVRTGRGAC